MIGVVIHSTERDVAEEFFELFKTPWEFYRSGQYYDVVICTQGQCRDATAKLVLLYSADATVFDKESGMAVRFCPGEATLCYDGACLPLYGKAVLFSDNPFFALKEEATQAPMAFLSRSVKGEVLRIGYDLFREVRLLLTKGQPSVKAGTAVLELHIALLRDLITRSGILLVEIPPVPDGYCFLACLTHDVDHPALRNHWCDHTMFGFLYRATIGSIVNLYRGRTTMNNLCRNWAAAIRLPFVYLGLAKDPWCGFDHYLEIEAGIGSTYFVIPKSGYPGRKAEGNCPAMRASRYTLHEIKPQLDTIRSAGCEVALHGLDAWLDSVKGGEEQEALSRAYGPTKSGVRMHWLYFDENSPAILERAGFSYDSSVGYNETVGYRAGTAQVYKLLGTTNLFELPLHIMDTALFYPSHLNLDQKDARQVVWRLIEDMGRFGGVLTINWHDRSIAPERLWDDFYHKLILELKNKGAWFPTAAEAVAWFKKRRSATFNTISWEDGVLKLSITAEAEPALPGLRVRVHQPMAQSLFESLPPNSSAKYVDLVFQNKLETSIAISA
jgi:hypothetical protein